MTPFGRSAVRVLRNDQTVELRYLHQDALGSVTLVTDEYGRVESRFAYDPWGKRLKTEDNRVQSTGGAMTRGFTDHEHLEDFELIHMNARVYDPASGRFLSADRVVQDMGDSQTYKPVFVLREQPRECDRPDRRLVRAGDGRPHVRHRRLDEGLGGGGKATGARVGRITHQPE
jgi:RHS repeat-associated protein